MSDEQTPVPDVVVRVRRDLRKIEELCVESVVPMNPLRLNAPEPRPRGFVGPMPEAVRRVRVTGARLLTEAVAAGNDPLMPGGRAMVAIAHISNLEKWANVLETAEEYAEARSWLTGEPTELPEIEDDDDWEPPLQTLEFWSERWRGALGHELDPERRGREFVVRRPSITSESTFLRWAVEWAVDSEPMFNRFVDEIARARARVENLLHDGVRSERGVPCLYEECRGIRLVRKLVPSRDEDGNKVWFHSKWHCPRCHRSWDEDEYARMTTAATEAAKIEDIPIVAGPGDEDDPADIVGYETWCSTEYAAHRTGRPAATIRVWAHRGRVASACLLSGRRGGFVRLEDVEIQHALAERRAEAVRAGKRRRRGHRHVASALKQPGNLGMPESGG